MSQLTVYGSVVSTPSEVHEPALAGETWKSTLWMPAPVSLGEAVSATVPRRNWPGSARPPPGGVASIVHVKEAGLASTLPAASVARTWKVWLPSARPA